MAYENLKAAIKQAIKQNDNQEITGPILQSTLLSMIDNIPEIVQELGSDKNKVMSQKVVSDKLNDLSDSNNDLALTISGLCNIKDTISRDTKYNIPLKRGNYSFERKNNEENRRCWIQFIDSSNNVFDYVELQGNVIIDKTLEKDAKYINVTIATIGQSIDIDIVNKFKNTLDSINTSVGNIFMFNKEVNYSSDVTNLFAIPATKGFITIISETISGRYWINFKDAEKNIIDYVEIKNKGRYIKYLNKEAVYISIATGGSTVNVNFSLLSNIAQDVSTLKEYTNCFTRQGSLSDFAGNDLILTNGQLENDNKNWNRYSNFIEIFKGQTVSFRSNSDDRHLAISFYTKPSFDSFVEGVAGENVRITKEYTYTANQHGFVVVSSCKYYIQNYTFEDSEYKISYFCTNNKFYCIDDSRLIKPFKEFNFVKDIVDSSTLEDNDERKTYPGLGYDVTIDTSGVYHLYSSAYSETVGYAVINHYTSLDMENWTYKGIMLRPSSNNEDPDSGSVTFPQILKVSENKWIMYYVGFDAKGFERGNHSVCYAESINLYNWNRKGKILDVTSFVNDGVWNEESLQKGVIYRPRVRAINGRYYMFINGGPNGAANVNGPNENIYYAVSDSPTRGWKVIGEIVNAESVYPNKNYKIISDPDVITDGQNYLMSCWSSEGIVFFYSRADKFPFCWEKLPYIIGGYMRPLLVPRGNGLYLFVNKNDGKKISLFFSEWTEF